MSKVGDQVFIVGGDSFHTFIKGELCVVEEPKNVYGYTLLRSVGRKVTALLGDSEFVPNTSNIAENVMCQTRLDVVLENLRFVKPIVGNDCGQSDAIVAIEEKVLLLLKKLRSDA
jgi:hypothetical protein